MMSNPAYPFGQITVDITPDLVKDYFAATPAAADALLDHMIIALPSTLAVFLDDHRDDFNEFLLGRMGGDF